mmetsp:Transcript_24003/g.60405  ORF Transcript_24003/g.60405 Transcript_24003/m.60405 type:complete len:223 (-) Transcript_24003:300-968(-)
MGAFPIPPTNPTLAVDRCPAQTLPARRRELLAEAEECPPPGPPTPLRAPAWQLPSCRRGLPPAAAYTLTVISSGRPKFSGTTGACNSDSPPLRLRRLPSVGASALIGSLGMSGGTSEVGRMQCTNTASAAKRLTQPGACLLVSCMLSSSVKWLQLRSSRWYRFPLNVSPSRCTSSCTSCCDSVVSPITMLSRNCTGPGASRGFVAKIPLVLYSWPPKAYSTP